MVNNKGQMLVEVLIGITVIVVVAVGVVRMSTRSLKSVRVSGDRQEALKLAEKVLADVMLAKEAGLDDFFDDASRTDDCGPLGDENQYSCSITYSYNSPPNSDTVTLLVEISWAEGGSTMKVSLDEVITKVKY